MLGKRRFSAAVAAENGNKAALPYRQIQPVKDGNLFAARSAVGKVKAAHFDCIGHGVYLAFVQRPVAPQGSTSPLCVTGRPSSSASLRPPKRGTITVSNRQRSTEGARPVV